MVEKNYYRGHWCHALRSNREEDTSLSLDKDYLGSLMDEVIFISKTSSQLLGPSVPAGRGKRARSREVFAPSRRHGLNLLKGCQKGPKLPKLCQKGTYLPKLCQKGLCLSKVSQKGR